MKWSFLVGIQFLPKFVFCFNLPYIGINKSNRKFLALVKAPSLKRSDTRPRISDMVEEDKVTDIKQSVNNMWNGVKRVGIAPLLLTFGIGYRVGIHATRATLQRTVSSSGTIATKSNPPYVLSAVLVAFAARELWKTFPDWIKRQIPYLKRRYKVEEVDFDPDDMTSLPAIAAKLQSLFALAQEKVVDAVRVPNPQLAFIALLKIFVQLKDERSRDRDRRYSEAGKNVENPKDVLEGMDDMFEFADWAYDELPDEKPLSEALKEKGFTLIRHDKVALPGSVAHYIAISKERKEALIGIKGSSSFEDLLTDCCMQAQSFDLKEPFIKGGPTEIRAHEGIMLASKRLADEVEVLVEELLLPSKYKLVITGHSLGASAAALLGMLLRSRFAQLRQENSNLLKVWAFASPPVLDYDAALACTPFTTTIVNNSDIIPRWSLSNLLIVMEYLKNVHNRLEERGMTAKDWKSTKSLFHMLTQSEEEGTPIMTMDEIRAAMTAANAKVELKDPDHLYVAGRVIQMYDLWSKEGYGQVSVADKEGAHPSKLSNNTIPETETEQNTRTAERVNVDNGASSILRYIELDSRMLTDHLSPAYRSSLNNLLSYGAAKVDELATIPAELSD
jgi:hypothetical protein